MIPKLQRAVSMFVLLLAALMPFAAQAKVDWEVANAVQLDEIPLDIARSQNNDLTFILTDQAKVLIYGAEGKMVGTVPVDPSVAAIATSADGEKLFLINSKRKTLQTIDINFIVDIDVADSPFLGPAGAEVVVAVFSDFQ